MTEPVEPAPGAVAEAADLGRRTAAAATVRPYTLEDDGALVVRTVRDDEQLEVHNLEEHLPSPIRARGSALLHDPQHFAGYVMRLADEHTTVWADEANRRFTAVFNDHLSDIATGWRDHTAVLALRVDPDWQAWTGRSGKLGGQADFAEFLDDNATAIVSPDAATMREIAATFSAHRNATFGQSIRLASGDVQLSWAEETTAKAGAKGNLEVPEQFTVRLMPFLGNEPVELTARLRYRIRDGQLAIGYQLHRPDIAEREAYTAILADITGRLDTGDGAVPVYLGVAPYPVSPRS